MNPGTRVCIYRSAYYNRAGRIVEALPQSTYKVRLEGSTEEIMAHVSDLEAIPDSKPLGLKPRLKG